MNIFAGIVLVMFVCFLARIISKLVVYRVWLSEHNAMHKQRMKDLKKAQEKSGFASGGTVPRSEDQQPIILSKGSCTCLNCNADFASLSDFAEHSCKEKT